MVRCKNCWTLLPNALTMWEGNPRDCNRSVRRLNSLVAEETDDAAAAPLVDVWLLPVLVAVAAVLDELLAAAAAAPPPGPAPPAASLSDESALSISAKPDDVLGALALVSFCFCWLLMPDVDLDLDDVNLENRLVASNKWFAELRLELPPTVATVVCWACCCSCCGCCWCWWCWPLRVDELLFTAVEVVDELVVLVVVKDDLDIQPPVSISNQKQPLIIQTL